MAALFVIAGFTALAGASTASTGTAPQGPLHPQTNQSMTLDPYNWPPANFSNLNAAPPPPVPATTPVVVNITQYGEVSIPSGQWETVIMNFSGYDAGTAYDYGGNVAINNITVFMSTQPEAGAWGVLANLSEFMSIFNGHSSIYFKGPFVPGLHKNFHGIQYNNISLLFYPIPYGWTAPSYPNIVEPLNAHLSPVPVTIPANTSAVELQTIMNQQEFWYSLNPAYDAAVVSTGGQNLTTLFSFPWINSGGIDLFSWRPINPVHMLDRPWTYTNLTPALGLLEQTQSINFAKASGYALREPSVNGNLLIWTNANVTGAKQLTYGYSDGPLNTYAVNNTSVVNVNGNHYSLIDQSKQISYQYSSEIMTATGHYTATVSTFESFNNSQTLNAVWQNITQLELVKSNVTTKYDEAGMHGVTHLSTVTKVPLAMQLGAELSFIYAQNRDRFYNYTSYFNNATQGLITKTMQTSFINGRASTYRSYVSDIVNTDGYFSSVLEFGPGFAIILNVTASHHYTQKTYVANTHTTIGHTQYGGIYYHTMAARENNSQSYYVQETVLFNVVKQVTF